MTRYYLRTEAGWKENLTAAALALGAGAAIFYFARILIAREPLEARPPSGDGASAPDDGVRPEIALQPGHSASPTSEEATGR